MLNLTSPIVVPPGSYYLALDSTSGSVSFAYGGASGSFIWSDAYSLNIFNLSVPFTFLNTTLFEDALNGYDSAAALIGITCVNEETITPTTCTPVPFQSYPANFSVAALLPCNAASQVVTEPYNLGVFNAVFVAGQDQVRLSPVAVTVNQTLYAITLLSHPATSGSLTYTLRPAVYIGLGNSPTGFNLLGQAAQTTIAGAALAGSFTYMTFPLLQPVQITAGTTVYVNAVVDQYGLYLQGTAAISSPANLGVSVSSSQTAPTSLTTNRALGAASLTTLLGCDLSSSALSASSSSGAAAPSSASSVSSSSAVPAGPTTTNASLCVIMYGLPGNIDYPWSKSLSSPFSLLPSLSRAPDTATDSAPLCCVAVRLQVPGHVRAADV